MSDQNPSQVPPEPGTTDGQSVSEAVQKVVESGTDVRERVRTIVVDLFRSARSSGESLRTAVRDVYETAADVVERSAPQDPDSVLKNVIDGISSGVRSFAQSAQYAIQEAAARGERFTSDDLDHARRNLNAASDILVDTVRYTSERVGAELGSGAKELKIHAERAVETVKPVLSSTLEAIGRHPVQTASEAAESTLKGGRLAAGAFLSAISGALAGAADLLDPDRDRKP